MLSSANNKELTTVKFKDVSRKTWRNFFTWFGLGFFMAMFYLGVYVDSQGYAGLGAILGFIGIIIGAVYMYYGSKM